MCIRVLAALLVAVTAVAQPDARAPMAVTYLANEGYLVEAGGTRVLIDALFRGGVEGYATLSRATQERLERGAAPFGDAAFVLASHVHDDHFDAGAVAAYLASSPETRFLSTPQAADALRAVVPPAGAHRIDAVLPREGERVMRRHRGVTVEALNIHHGRTRPTQNLGLLVTIGGHRVLHIGDAEATAADLGAAKIANDRADVFFVPYWYFTSDDGRRAVRETGARHVVIMHAAAPSADSAIRRAGSFAAWVDTVVRPEFPSVIWLEREGLRIELR